MVNLKRSISVLLAFCLILSTLVSLSLVGASAAVFTRPVTHIEKASTNGTTLSQIVSNTKIKDGEKYVLSFEYLFNTTLVNDKNKVSIKNTNDQTTLTETTLSAGRNTFSVEFDGKGNNNVLFDIYFRSQDASVSKFEFYFWDFKICKKGDTANLATADWSANNTYNTVETIEYDGILLGDSVPVKHIKATGNLGANIRLAVPKASFSANETYQVTFDYRFNGDHADDRNRVAFNDENGQTSLTNTNRYLELGRHTFTETFTYTGTGDVTFHFYLRTIDNLRDFECYIWNFKVTKVGDSQNLATAEWRDEANGNLIEVIEYDGVLLDDSKPVTHIKTNSPYGVFLRRTVAKTQFESNQTYQLSFEYYFIADRTDDINRAIIKNANNQTSFTETRLEKGRKTFTQTFTYTGTQDVLFEFYFRSNNNLPNFEIYIWDFTITKVGDSENLSPEEWRQEANGNIVEIVEYDAEVMEPGIINYPTDEIKGLGLGESVSKTYDSLAENTNYTLSFSYSLASGTNYKYQIRDMSEKARFTQDLTAGTHSVSITFSQEGDSKVMPAIYAAQVDTTEPKLYIWDMKLTQAASDKDLLSDVEWAGNNYGSSEIVTEDSLLPDVTDPMLKISVPKAQNGKETLATKQLTTPLDPNKSYRVTFDYYLTESIVGASDRFYLNGYNDVGYTDLVIKNIDGSKGRHTYTNVFTGMSSLKKIGFRFVIWSVQDGVTTYAYVWNFKLTEEGSSVNLIKDTAWSDTTKAVAATYDESLFADTANTMTEIKDIPFGSDVSKKIAGLEENKNYKISFDYFLNTDITGCAMTDKSESNRINISLERGKHSVSAVFNSGTTTQVTPTLNFDDEDGVLYIWNFKITEVDGSENLLAKGMWSDSRYASFKPYDESLFVEKFDMLRIQIQGKGSIEQGRNLYKLFENLEVGAQYEVSFKYYSTGGFATAASDITGLNKPRGKDNKIPDETTGDYFLNIGEAREFSHTITAAANPRAEVGKENITKMAIGMEIYTVFNSGTLYIWDYKVVKVGDETQTNMAASVNWTINKNLTTDWVEYDPSLFKIDNLGEKGNSQMLRFDSYYYDLERGKIIIDQEVVQRFGAGQNGVTIKPNTTYVFSFDYYCSEGNVQTSCILKTLYSHYEKSNVHLWTTGQKQKRGLLMDEGRGTMTAEFTTYADQNDFILGFAQGVDGYTYIWNIKLVEKGTDENLFPNSDFSYGFKNWMYPKTESDETVASEQVSLLDINPKLLTLEKGEIMPDEDELFYAEDLWGASLDDEKKDDDEDEDYDFSDGDDYLDDSFFENEEPDDEEITDAEEEENKQQTVVKKYKYKKKKKNTDNSMSTVAIVLIVVACVVVLAGGAVTTLLLVLKKKHRMM